MTDGRKERILELSTELNECIAHLATNDQQRLARFLACFARLSRFTEDEISMAGQLNVFEQARAAMSRLGNVVPQLAVESLNSQALSVAGQTIALKTTADTGDVTQWGIDMLFISEVHPFLSAESQATVRDHVYDALAWLGVNPRNFLALNTLADSRSEHENPPHDDTLSGEVFTEFLETPVLVLEEQTENVFTEDEERVRAKVRRKAHAPDAQDVESWFQHFVEAGRDALAALLQPLIEPAVVTAAGTGVVDPGEQKEVWSDEGRALVLVVSDGSLQLHFLAPLGSAAPATAHLGGQRLAPVVDRATGKEIGDLEAYMRRAWYLPNQPASALCLEFADGPLDIELFGI